MRWRVHRRQLAMATCNNVGTWMLSSCEGVCAFPVGATAVSLPTRAPSPRNPPARASDNSLASPAWTDFLPVLDLKGFSAVLEHSFIRVQTSGHTTSARAHSEGVTTCVHAGFRVPACGGGGGDRNTLRCVACSGDVSFPSAGATQVTARMQTASVSDPTVGVSIGRQMQGALTLRGALLPLVGATTATLAWHLATICSEAAFSASVDLASRSWSSLIWALSSVLSFSNSRTSAWPAAQSSPGNPILSARSLSLLVSAVLLKSASPPPAT